MFLITLKQNYVSKAKIVTMHFGFTAYVKVKCMITIAQKAGGQNGNFIPGK